MKIALVTADYAQDPTFVSILGGLDRAYRALGHSTRLPTGELGLRPAWKLLEGADFAHVQTSGCYVPRLPSVWLALRLRGTPYGLTFQDFGLHPGHPSGASLRWHRPVIEAFASRASWLSAVSESVAHELGRHYPALRGRLRVVPNGWDPARLSPDPAAPARPRPYVLCVARHRWHKGLDILLWAWKDAQARLPGWDLVIAGRDQLEGHLPALARTLRLDASVEFLGQVPPGRVAALMRDCEVFTLPSRSEAFGMAALEAMALGRAVVATRAGGFPDFIRDQETGVLVPPSDPGALAQALVELAGDPGLRGRLGGAAQRTADCFTWDAAAERYLELCGVRARRPRREAAACSSPESA